jgi:von Willebrand factor type A domain
VLTASTRAMSQAVTAFGRFLQTPYAQGVIRSNGFRSPDGTANPFPASSGLGTQPLQVAPAAKPAEAATTLAAWQRLGLGSKDLTIIDDSSVMSAPTGVGNLTLEQLLAQSAARGLALFPDSTQMSLWVAPNSQNTASSYRELVTMGPLAARYGVITRRQQIQEIDQTLRPSPHPLHLNDAILAAYQQMTSTYTPNYANAVIVLTAGVDARGDMSTSALLNKLHQLYNSSRRVEVVVLMFGTAGDFTSLQRIATATGGVAYKVTDPIEIGKVFIEAISHRL